MMLYSLALIAASTFAGQSVSSFAGSCLAMTTFYLAHPPLHPGGDLSMDSWAWAMGMLSISSVVLVSYAQSLAYLQPRGPLFSGLLGGLLAALLTCFSLDVMLGFYIFFEASALAVFLLIMGFGYQPERATASLFLILFTLASSLPLLVALSLFWSSLGASSFSDIGLSGAGEGCGGLFSVLVLAGFLVKFPMYFFHIWLPKAHVEASAGGSMILAGVLLKLGGYGLVRVLPLVAPSGAPGFVIHFALGGGLIISALCTRLVDFKVLVAYSSVAHMSLVIAALLSQTPSGGGGGLAMSLAHGLASSALFFSVGVLFSASGSRLFFFNQGGMAWSPWFVFFMFVFCAFNMGVPPTFNFWAEILMILSVSSQFPLLSAPLGACLFLAVVFSVALFLGAYAQKSAYAAGHSLLVSPKDLGLLLLHLALLLYAPALFPLLFK